MSERREKEKQKKQNMHLWYFCAYSFLFTSLCVWNRFDLVEDHLIEFNSLATACMSSHSEARYLCPLGLSNPDVTHSIHFPLFFIVLFVYRDMLNRVMTKDNIAVTALLRSRASQTRVYISNVHIHWDPSFKDVKLVQTAFLTDQLKVLFCLYFSQEELCYLMLVHFKHRN